MITEKRELELKEFLNRLNVDCNLNDLDVALTHSSFCKENNLPYDLCNERLEFLGDAVLKITISNFLYKKYPNYNEGALSQIRSCVVSDETLNKIAKGINLAKYIILGHAEEHNKGRHRSSTVACAFEAMLGAFYLSGKLPETQLLIEKLFENIIEEVNADSAKSNYKALLQEYFQVYSNNVPEYVLTRQEGPPHNRTFYVDVFFEEEFLASGTGSTKKAAQKEAAKLACKKIGLLNQENLNE